MLSSDSDRRHFEGMALKNGWRTIEGGWPNYMCIKNGVMMCVQVKPRGEELSHEQIGVLQNLTKMCIECYVWEPNSVFHDEGGLTRYIPPIKLSDL